MVNSKQKSRKTHIRVNLLFIFFLFFSVFGAILTIYIVFYNDEIDDCREKAESVVYAFASSIDAKSVKKYQETPVIDDNYRSQIRRIDEYAKKAKIKKVFVVAPFDDNHYMYIYDSSENGDGIEDSIYGRRQLGEKQEMNDWSTDIFSGNDNYKKSDIYRSNSEYGFVCTAVTRIKDENNKVIAFIGIDYDMNIELETVYRSFAKTLIILVIAFTVFGFLSWWLMNNFLAKPIRQITFAVEHIMDSKLTKISKKTIKIINKNDDIAVLADVFNKMISNLHTYTENIKKINSEKEQIATELNIATQIQTSLIPQTFPAFPELSEIDIYANSKPAKKVGGDFYDFFLLDSDHLVFVIADVSGKGISAALFMVIARTLIRNEASIDKTPGEILNKVNKQMCLDNDLGMFLTLFLGILNFKTGDLSFSNAGHLKPIYKFRDNKFKEINVKKNFVIAGMSNLNFKDEKIKMNPNDIIFMYTDGIVESLDQNNSQSVGVNGLINLLNSIDTSKCSLKYIIDLVQQDIKKISKGKQFDDETMLIIKFKGYKSNK